MAGTLITDRRTASANYKMLRRLGKGGMAEVFLARQEGIAGFARLAVVKKILPQFSSVSNVAEMLLDEARIAGQLSHPNIVQIYELGQDEGQYFIAMEFVDGCDLATLARIERHRQSRVPIRLSLRVVSEAAMGLDYAHRQIGLDGRPLNLVHRDVSPHNILCSREGAVKVTDFGIVKAVGKEQVTEVGVVKGKIQYMAPEQYTGGEVDARSDIFSLGVVLYQLTTGRLPRVTKSGAVAMRRVIEGDIPRPAEIRSDYPEQLEAIVMRALAQNPEERYVDGASFRDDLLDFARQNDMLAFPKELGDYVDELVPPVPLTDEERGTPSSIIVSASLGKEVEDGPTGAPHGTEVVSHSGGNVITADRGSDPLGDTQIPIDTDDEAKTDDRALLTNESMTPLPECRDPLRDRSRRDPRGGGPKKSRERSVPKAGKRRLQGTPARPAEEVETRAGKIQTQTEPLRRAKSNLGVGLFAGAVIATSAFLAYWLVVKGGGPSDVRIEADARAKTVAVAGQLKVKVTPKKASIAVDGAQRCPASPCRIAGLPLGRELLVTIRASGYNVWMQRIVLTPAVSAMTFQVRLVRLGAPPVLADAGQAPDAKRAGGKRAGGKRAGGKRAGGKRAGGKRSPAAAESQRPKKGRGRVLTVPAGSAEKTQLAVDVRPAWAEVWVDGVKVGNTPIQVSVPPGRHTIELKNPRFKFHNVYRLKFRKGRKIKISDTIVFKR